MMSASFIIDVIAKIFCSCISRNPTKRSNSALIVSKLLSNPATVFNSSSADVNRFVTPTAASIRVTYMLPNAAANNPRPIIIAPAGVKKGTRNAKAGINLVPMTIAIVLINGMTITRACAVAPRTINTGPRAAAIKPYLTIDVCVASSSSLNANARSRISPTISITAGARVAPSSMATSTISPFMSPSCFENDSSCLAAISSVMPAADLRSASYPLMLSDRPSKDRMAITDLSANPSSAKVFPCCSTVMELNAISKSAIISPILRNTPSSKTLILNCSNTLVFFRKAD